MSGLLVVIMMIEEQSGGEDVGSGREFALMMLECWKYRVDLMADVDRIIWR